MTTRARIQASEGCTSVQEGSKQLLPGIPDEITLYNIVPKLPWEAFYVLSSVSRAWLHGIRTRQVYDARVVSQSTETLVVSLDRPTGGLISFRENPPRKRRGVPSGVPLHPGAGAWTHLPPTPFPGGKWVCSEGYIYLLGGSKRSSSPWCGNKVSVFDVAGQRQWRECANMIEPRERFGCQIMHGKIYVFGGVSMGLNRRNLKNPSAFCGSEVYDPKEDCWSPIKPMKTLRFRHRVEIVGDELFVHGGLYFDRDHFNARNINADTDTSDEDELINYNRDSVHVANFVEVYHPVKDEWRVISPFERDSRDLFGAGGNLYSINWSSIHVYSRENSWTHMHSFSFPTSSVHDSVLGWTSFAIVVDGEVLVEASWQVVIDGLREYRYGQFQSKGFGGESKEIMWQEVTQFSLCPAGYWRTSNNFIQL